jgi:hypothetical protein
MGGGFPNIFWKKEKRMIRKQIVNQQNVKGLSSQPLVDQSPWKSQQNPFLSL